MEGAIFLGHGARIGSPGLQQLLLKGFGSTLLCWQNSVSTHRNKTSQRLMMRAEQTWVLVCPAR